MYQRLIALLLGVLLLPSLSLANPAGSPSRTNWFSSVFRDAPGPTLLSSKFFQPRFTQKGISCNDLMPDALENFAAVPQLAQIFIQAALVLALQGGGCTQHADILVQHLYREQGETDANALLSVMARSLGTANSSGQSKSSAALQFNLDQLAYTQARRCKGLMQIEKYVLHGKVHSVHRGFSAAAAACRQQRNACAGVVSNGTGFYQVVEREGSYFLAHYGARSWLHQCQVARNRRSAPENCTSEKEQKVYAVVEWIPVVSTYYNLGTSIYYATQNCTSLAKERALEGAMDLGYDALVALTGGTGSIVRMGISAGLKPVVKAGIRASINYFYREEKLDPIPTSYSGPVIIT